MVSLNIKITHDKTRDINSWFFCLGDKYEDMMDKLIKAHLDIYDIFISPTACFLIFPIDYKPPFGKVYKDMFLIHPLEMPDDLLPVFCVNDRLLDTCFPDEEKAKELIVKSKNMNKVRYIDMIDDKEFYDGIVYERELPSNRRLLRRIDKKDKK